MNNADPVDILYIGFVLGHGGDAAQMLALASAMQRRGKSIRVIVPEIRTTLDLAKRAAERGVELIRSPLLRADPIAPRQVPADLELLFRSHPARLLHLHTGDFCVSRTVPAALGEVGIPRSKVIVTVHSPYDTLEATEDRAVSWARTSRERLRYIVCPSQHARRVQLKYGVGEEVAVHVANGIDGAYFAGGSGERVRCELGLTQQDRLLLFTSRLDKQKRPLDALAAFNLLTQEFPTLHIAFAGVGELEDQLRELARLYPDRVHLLGHRADVPDLLAAADAWILPTEAENFSLAVLEALAAGCAIISTRCSGNDEILADGDNALLTEVGDIRAISAAVRRILNDTNLRERLRSGAKLTPVDENLMVERYLTLYGAMERETGEGK